MMDDLPYSEDMREIEDVVLSGENVREVLRQRMKEDGYDIHEMAELMNMPYKEAWRTFNAKYNDIYMSSACKAADAMGYDIVLRYRGNE